MSIGTIANGFVVEDNGPGISTDIREHVFEVGFTTNNTHENGVHDPSLSGRGCFCIPAQVSAMIDLQQRLKRRTHIDVERTDDIYVMMERALDQSRCELCESIRDTDSEYGMEVCRSCRRELLPA